MYTISKHWKYISISIGFITFLILLNNQKPTVEIDINLLRNTICTPQTTTTTAAKEEEQQPMTNNGGDTVIDQSIWDSLPVKGAIYMVVQNAQLQPTRSTIRSLEDRFNSNLNSSYPWILLNSQGFTDEFKYFVRKAAHDPTRVFFGQIDLEAWSLPYWIDSNRAENAQKKLVHYQVEKADSQYYHQLQRYQSGLFMHHSLFDSVEYVWQVEIGSSYHCDLFKNDPFMTMQSNNKNLGFVLTSSTEPASSMYSLWPATLQFMKQYASWILKAEDSIMPWLVNDKTKEYSFCSMWTSFQIVKLDFLRSLEYQVYFQYLDYVGGFFYERWTAASIRSIAAAMFLDRSDFHFFNDVGYAERRGLHCPLNKKLLESCTCEFEKSYVLDYSSCNLELLKLIDQKEINSMVDFALTKLNEEEQEEENFTS